MLYVLYISDKNSDKDFQHGTPRTSVMGPLLLLLLYISTFFSWHIDVIMLICACVSTILALSAF